MACPREEAEAAAAVGREGRGGEGKGWPGWLVGLPSEITAFESKAHAKKDYSHVGKRGEMAARPTAQAPALAKHGRRARAVGGMLTS